LSESGFSGLMDLRICFSVLCFCDKSIILSLIHGAAMATLGRRLSLRPAGVNIKFINNRIAVANCDHRGYLSESGFLGLMDLRICFSVLCFCDKSIILSLIHGTAMATHGRRLSLRPAGVMNH